DVPDRHIARESQVQRSVARIVRFARHARRLERRDRKVIQAWPVFTDVCVAPILICGQRVDADAEHALSERCGGMSGVELKVSLDGVSRANDLPLSGVDPQLL